MLSSFTMPIPSLATVTNSELLTTDSDTEDTALSNGQDDHVEEWFAEQSKS